ncbi:MAG TPA: SRPBCC family protein [Vicinamibacterales bacterium]|nr:SRPBCC family protein [Vicinamibacterales bacterium]
MDATLVRDRDISLADAEAWLALGAGALLLIAGASRRSVVGTCLAVSSAPLLYRGVTGHWPAALAGGNGTRAALGGDAGIHVRESVRLELSRPDVYREWRRLENLPRFMRHLRSVTETSARESHWVAMGPGGLAVEWDAEIINDVENETLAWRSLPGGDVVSAGSVNFDTVRDGRSTQVTVHLQYAPPAGRAGALIASLFGREPTQTVREDLRRFKRLLEAGEAPRTSADE